MPISFPGVSPVLTGAWNRIAAARRRLLMLDYDGTLAPLRVERDRAVPERRTREALQAIAVLHEPVVVISGRPVEQLRVMLDQLPVTMVGEHGWEQGEPGAPVVQHALPDDTAARLELARRAALAAGWKDQVEAKRTSIVLHTRGLAPARAAALERDGRTLWGRHERDGVWLEPVDGGLELRAAGRGKGEVAWELMQREPAGTLPVFIGDDATDEQAFRVLRPHGVTIRVGRPHMPTAAEWRLATPDDVTSFLLNWPVVVTGSPSWPR